MLTLSIVIAMLSAIAPLTDGQTTGARANSSGGPIHACALLTASEVKKLAALPDPLNLYATMPPQEEPLGKGSSCNYPNLHVQIDPFDWATIDSLRIKNATQFEAVPEVGDEAYLRGAVRPCRFAHPYNSDGRAGRENHGIGETRVGRAREVICGKAAVTMAVTMATGRRNGRSTRGSPRWASSIFATRANERASKEHLRRSLRVRPNHTAYRQSLTPLSLLRCHEAPSHSSSSE